MVSIRRRFEEEVLDGGEHEEESVGLGANCEFTYEIEITLKATVLDVKVYKDYSRRSIRTQWYAHKRRGQIECETHHWKRDSARRSLPKCLATGQRR